MKLFNLFGKQELKTSPNDMENLQKGMYDAKVDDVVDKEKMNEQANQTEIDSNRYDIVVQNVEDKESTNMTISCISPTNENEINYKKEEYKLSACKNEFSDETSLSILVTEKQKDMKSDEGANETFHFQSVETDVSMISSTSIGASYENLEDSRKNFALEEKNKRYVIGDVGGTFYQTPYFAKKSDVGAFHRNDIVADIAKMGNMLVMGASLRGESHYAHKIPRQDSFLIEECVVNDKKKFVIAAIADGVGNAKRADEFSEMLVNFLCNEISKELHKVLELEEIDWLKISEQIWRISVNYCYQKSNSKNTDDYFQYWASTLECVVVEAQSENETNFIAVTISGDGGIYRLDSSRNWIPIKHGKIRNNPAVSNMVYCLPDKPDDIIIKTGCLKRGEMLFLVTDGLSDYIEEYEDVRQFFGNRLPNFVNLPEFIRVMNVAVKQMDDDKTGVLISYYDEHL